MTERTEWQPINAEDLDEGDVFRLALDDTEAGAERVVLEATDGVGTVTIKWKFAGDYKARRSTYRAHRVVYAMDEEV